jgi:hypothetical protein
VSTAIVALPEKKQDIPRSGPTKRGRKSRQSAEDASRFFLGKTGSSSGRPELGEEATDENQALIKAFQQGGVIYVITSYRVEAEIQGGTPILVKRPLQKQGH